MTAGEVGQPGLPHPPGTLAAAQAWLRDQLDEGARCPCCTQFAKVYRRKVTSAVARVLIAMWRANGAEWVHIPSLGSGVPRGGDEAKARYWDLIEPMPDVVRDDGSTRSGWWRLTPRGVAFVRNELVIPKYVRVYDGRALGVDDSDGYASIRDALGTRFNYTDLMAGM